MSAEPTPDSTRNPAPVEPVEPLEATVVQYQRSPDRCTVSPAEVSEERQLTAWISVDVAALVTLAEMR